MPGLCLVGAGAHRRSQAIGSRGQVHRDAAAADPHDRVVVVGVRCDGNAGGQWDRARLHQALSNLLGNAAQHGMPGRPVSVVVQGEPTEVVVTVHNEGPPIPPELMPSIFKPLVQGSAQAFRRHRRPGSIGLGLYIVREIAAVHGGTVEVESSEGAGTMYTLRLPREPVARTSASATLL